MGIEYPFDPRAREIPEGGQQDRPAAGPRRELYADMLAQLVRSCATANGLDELLLECLEQLTHKLKFDAAVVYTLSDDGSVLNPVAADGIERGPLADTRIQPGNFATGRAFERCRPELLDGSRAALSASDDPIATGCKAMMAVPLLHFGKAVGALAVATSDGSIDKEDGERLMEVGGLLAQFIQARRWQTVVKHNDQRWQQLFEDLPVGVTQYSEDGKILRWNEKLSRMLGIESARVLGESIFHVLPTEFVDLAKYLTGKARRRGRPAWDILRPEISEDHRIRRGVYRMVVLPVKAPGRESGEVVERTILVLSEITVSNDVAARGDLAPEQRQFLSMVQHELRTPVTSLKGALHILLEADAGGTLAEHRPLLRILEKNTERLTLLIGDMLDVMSITMDELTLMNGRVDLAKAIRGALRELKVATRSRNVEARILAPEEPLRVWGDAAKLQQVFRHLLDNGLKFSPAGAALEIRLKEAGDVAVVEIADQGPGIPSDFLPKAFELFTQQGEALSRSAAGNGIGLFLARAIVDLHGGTVEIPETSSSGTTVRVRLPLLHTHAAPSRTFPAVA